MSNINQEISEEKSQTVLSPSKSVKLRISRSNSETNSEEKFDEFVVPVEKSVKLTSLMITSGNCWRLSNCECAVVEKIHINKMKTIYLITLEMLFPSIIKMIKNLAGLLTCL